MEASMPSLSYEETMMVRRAEPRTRKLSQSFAPERRGAWPWVVAVIIAAACALAIVRPLTVGSPRDASLRPTAEQLLGGHHVP
jgi:hypothetical protein